MFKTLSLSTIALLSASAATAQGVEYLSYGAGYTNLSDGDTSANIYALYGAVDYRVNNAFISGGLGYTRLSDSFDDFGITNITARGGYFVAPQAVIYGGINYFDADDVDSFTSYDIGAEYSFASATVGLNYDDSNEAGYESTVTVYASYRMNETLEAGLFYSDNDFGSTTSLGMDYDDGTFDVAAVLSDFEGETIFGIDASYAFGNDFRASGGYVDLDGFIDILSVGAGYEVSSDMWVDLEFGRASDGVDDIDVISLALTYELGRETLLIDRAQSTQTDALGVFGGLIAASGF